MFTDDGFVKTGDIGELMPTGAIKIIDRAKMIFKLAHGEYICPTSIEIAFEQSEFIH
jgi:long-chain acyl-CoA synthetase